MANFYKLFTLFYFLSFYKAEGIINSTVNFYVFLKLFFCKKMYILSGAIEVLIIMVLYIYITCITISIWYSMANIYELYNLFSILLLSVVGGLIQLINYLYYQLSFTLFNY